VVHPAGTWGYPHPYFGRNPLVFLGFTGRVALQNIENNEVPCKIFLAKELRAVSATVGSSRLKGGAKKTCGEDDLKEEF
jgi:hypothetical protein